MALDRRKPSEFEILLLGIAVRVLLIALFPSLPDLLTSRVEISTPVTSFKRLQEGLYLYTHSLPAYEGGLFHNAPLLLPLFSLLPSSTSLNSQWATHALYIILDVLSATSLMSISRSSIAIRTKSFLSPRANRAWSPVVVGAAFLLNPFTIATCLSRSTAVFTTCAILAATARASQGKWAGAMLAIAWAGYLAIYPLLLVPPLVLVSFTAIQRQQDSKTKDLSLAGFGLRSTALLLVSLATLLFLSYIQVGDLSFIRAVYGTRLLLPDLTPNVGLWWYFFIEIFDSFRPFFLSIFWLHLLIYVGGTTIRLRKQPLAALVCLVGLIAIFQPYPSISDSSLFLGLLPCYAHIFQLMRYSFLLAVTLSFTTLLGPAFWYLWIYAGSGNANFFYAITLVWSLGMALVVADTLFAVLRDEWELTRPDMKGKELRQI